MKSLLTACSGYPEDPVKINSIKITPDPPQIGENMTVTVEVTAREKIEVRRFKSIILYAFAHR